MANNKKSSNKTINILIIACTVAIIALAVLVAISFSGNSNEGNLTSNTSTNTENLETKDEEKFGMSKVIEDLKITENPVATLEMENGGVITIELYPEIAPNTVCNFIELANSGYYDGLIFHRCIPGFMIQGGCPDGTGMGDPGYSIAGEFSSNGFENSLNHDRGVVSMARSGDPDSAGSQFFIMVEVAPHLDGEYAAFGKVISGMEVADAIVANETGANDKPLVDQVIKSIKVDTKGITYPEAKKIK